MKIFSSKLKILFVLTGVGTSSNPCKETYKGKRSFSEPCVYNLRRYLENNRRNLIGYIGKVNYEIE